MLQLFAIFAAIILLLLLFREKSCPIAARSTQRHVVFKGGATVCVLIVAALAWWRPITGQYLPYTLLICAGLTLSIIGDIALVFEQPRMFLLGMLAFAFAHVCYVIAFWVAQSHLGIVSNVWRDIGVAAALFGLSTVFYRYVRPHLGELRQPVVLYITLISLMLHRAASSADYSAGIPLQPVLALMGATLFYVSDFMLSINKFVFESDTVQDSVLVLGFYYTAQIALALSTSFL